MVTIINYKKLTTDTGKDFCLLEIQGGIEMVRSQSTGLFYATAKKCFISSTFDELTSQALVGSQLNGSVVKIDCEEYEYTIKETGEIVTLAHKYVYTEEEIPTGKQFANIIENQIQASSY
ncbi:hypothetical protein [Sphingobacterium paucimobilis]|uniref:Uncharacterized protein n=1 Tax=Sphingobacterium paucimobilis HER1398 TaxID=1346330 RepID=U2HRL3_9SPHI|nr:hypothetical protein [Sphingobacterium paucimobilis]ERJ58112.1 hypothetical protein M472_04975 [Sphingobacterium paucimobilis HER1398]